MSRFQSVCVCDFCRRTSFFVGRRTSHCRKLIDGLTYTSDTVCLRMCDSRSVKHESLKARPDRPVMFYVTRMGTFGLMDTELKVRLVSGMEGALSRWVFLKALYAEMQPHRIWWEKHTGLGTKLGFLKGLFVCSLWKLNRNSKRSQA